MVDRPYKCRRLQRRDVAIQSSHKDIDALNLTLDTYNRDSNAIYCRVIICCQTLQTNIQAKKNLISAALDGAKLKQ